MITEDQVQAVLEALGEEFVVDIPAEHSGTGDYKIDYFTLCTYLTIPDAEWVSRIAGYVNSKELLGDSFRG